MNELENAFEIARMKATNMQPAGLDIPLMTHDITEDNCSGLKDCPVHNEELEKILSIIDFNTQARRVDGLIAKDAIRQAFQASRFSTAADIIKLVEESHYHLDKDTPTGDSDWVIRRDYLLKKLEEYVNKSNG